MLTDSSGDVHLKFFCRILNAHIQSVLLSLTPLFWPFSPQGNLILPNSRLHHSPQATR